MWHNESGAMTPGQVFAPGTILFNLILPVTEIGVGIFRFDPLEKLLGKPLTYILQPALRAPSHRRPSAAGPAVNVYPLHLPPGEGVSMRLGNQGDIGFANDQGCLRIVAPQAASGWLCQRLAPWMVRGPEQALSVDQTAWVTMVWIRLEPGMNAAIPMPGIGEIGVEVG